MPPRGFVFDMDGTLVDSGLDFQLMRAEMGLPAGVPILEALRNMSALDRLRCEAILLRHEQAGAERATAMPGAQEFLQTLDRRGIPRALLTRNARDLTLALLARLGLSFEQVWAREDGPAKPAPTILLKICEQWQLAPAEVAIVGDFHYDLQAGRNAGTQTVLFTGGRDLSHLPWTADADLLLHSFHDAEQLLLG